MTQETLDRLLADGLLRTDQHAHLRRVYGREIFSLFYELRTLLYLGVLLFTTGIGILVYKNIDTIGHQVLIAALALLDGWCFWFVGRRRRPFSRAMVPSPGVLHDYMLLLASLLFATLVAYLQVEYAVFGDHLALSALLPALLYLSLAYAFDHRGVLGLGLTAVASWLGLTVSPIDVMRDGFHSGDALIVTGILYGAVVDGIALALDRAGIKKHFTFTALNIGSHVLCISLIAAAAALEPSVVYSLLLLGVCVLGVLYARREQSFLFLLFSCIYGYIGFTWMISDVFESAGMGFLYIVVSCGAIIYVVFNYRKFLARP